MTTETALRDAIESLGPRLTEPDICAFVHALLTVGSPANRGYQSEWDEKRQAWNTRPRSRQRMDAPRRIAEELAEIEEKARDLCTLLDGIHDGTASVFRPVVLRDTKARLRIMAAEARAAAADPPTTGAEVEVSGPQKLALEALHAFWAITREKPRVNTRPGARPGFLDFVVKVFLARGVKDSAEVAARWAVERIAE